MEQVVIPKTRVSKLKYKFYEITVHEELNEDWSLRVRWIWCNCDRGKKEEKPGVCEHIQMVKPLFEKEKQLT